MKPTMIPDDEIVAREIVLNDDDIRPVKSPSKTGPRHVRDDRESEYAEDEIYYPDDESHRHPPSRRGLKDSDFERMSYDNEFAPFEIKGKNKSKWENREDKIEAFEDDGFPGRSLRGTRGRKETPQLEFDGNEDVRQSSRMSRKASREDFEDSGDDWEGSRHERKIIDKSIKKPAMKVKKEVSKKKIIEKKKDPNVTLNEDGSFNYINLDETDHEFS